jgi:dehydrogenase/reductase SDR family member 7B
VAREGAKVVLTARRAEALQAVAAACAPAEAQVLPADLLDLDADDLADRARAAFGRIDVLVNNAGMSQRATALETGLPVVRDLMELNFFAPVALTRAVAPDMVARGHGRIVVVSSIAGHVGTPLRSTYCASKHAVEAWFESLRAELHGTGVGVTVVAPGYIRTDISRRARSADGSAYGRMGAGNAHGMGPDTCAARMADAIHRGREHLFVGGREVLAVHLHRLSPALIRRFLHRAAPEDA